MVSDATLNAVRPYKDAYALDFTLANGKRVSGFRGQSLGKPELGPCTVYVKKSDFDQHGNNGTWNLGFAPVDDFNPFE